jgi:hypothetical protein
MRTHVFAKPRQYFSAKTGVSPTLNDTWDKFTVGANARDASNTINSRNAFSTAGKPATRECQQQQKHDNNRKDEKETVSE